MFGSLQKLGKQVEQVVEMWNGFKLPADYKKVSSIVVSGMGGSALGAHIIKTLFAGELRVPVEIINDYHLPAYVGKNTLVIASSYSGNTEETVNALEEAKKKKAKIVVICARPHPDQVGKHGGQAGGNLAELAKKYNWPALVFSTENNPCGSPRMGLGYSLAGQLLIFSKFGVLNFSKDKLANVSTQLEKYGGTLIGVAKELAKKTIDKTVWYVASEHLLGNAHTAANQMNENGKRFGGYFAIPELNHHLMEVMLNPDSNKNSLLFILLESKLYNKRVQRRYEVTKDVLVKNKINFESYELTAGDKVGQMCEALALCGYISYYSAILNNIDPTDIPFVDYFKEQLVS